MRGRGRITGRHIKVGQKGVDEGGLGEMNRDIAGGSVNRPFIVSAQKPFNSTHEVDANEGGQG